MSHLVFKNNKESEQELEFCTEKEFCVIDIIKSTDFHNAEMKFEKLPEKYLVESNNPQIKNTSETVSNVQLESDSKKTSPLCKTWCSESNKACSLNRSAKGGNTKFESCGSKFSHSSKSKNILSIHTKASLSKSSSSKSLSNSGPKYSNAYYLSLHEHRKTS